MHYLFIGLMLTSLATKGQSSQQRLIVILVDGVRWDYIERDSALTGFRRIAKEGVKAQYVTPIFPSVSYPNWYTIVTGLYAESHGFVDNNMYDPIRKDTFLMTPPNTTHEHWWNKTEPLWINAEKNGKRVAMHYWDGCQVSIRGNQPMLCEPYRPFWNWTTNREELVDKAAEVVRWFEEREDHQLALFYYEGPDAYGHKYGPDSPELKQELRDTDNLLDRMQDVIESSKIKDMINFVVVSDHGMTDIQDFKKVDLGEYKVKDDIEFMLSSGAQGGIIPVAGKEDKLYEALKGKSPGMDVYRKDEIPDMYHLRNGELTMPLLLVAKLGYIILKPDSSYQIKGTHGFDPYVLENDGGNQMRTIMYARGPAFLRGKVGQPMEQTDHYNIFCHILDLKPQTNNGSWDRVKGILASGAVQHVSCNAAIIVAISLAVLCTWTIVYHPLH